MALKKSSQAKRDEAKKARRRGIAKSMPPAPEEVMTPLIIDLLPQDALAHARGELTVEQVAIAREAYDEMSRSRAMAGHASTTEREVIDYCIATLKHGVPYTESQRRAIALAALEGHVSAHGE